MLCALAGSRTCPSPSCSREALSSPWLVLTQAPILAAGGLLGIDLNLFSSFLNHHGQTTGQSPGRCDRGSPAAMLRSGRLSAGGPVWPSCPCSGLHTRGALRGPVSCSFTWQKRLQEAKPPAGALGLGWERGAPSRWHSCGWGGTDATMRVFRSNPLVRLSVAGQGPSSAATDAEATAASGAAVGEGASMPRRWASACWAVCELEVRVRDERPPGPSRAAGLSRLGSADPVQCLMVSWGLSCPVDCWAAPGLCALDASSSSSAVPGVHSELLSGQQDRLGRATLQQGSRAKKRRLLGQPWVWLVMETGSGDAWPGGG